MYKTIIKRSIQLQKYSSNIGLFGSLNQPLSTRLFASFDRNTKDLKETVLIKRSASTYSDERTTHFGYKARVLINLNDFITVINYYI